MGSKPQVVFGAIATILISSLLYQVNTQRISEKVEINEISTIQNTITKNVLVLNFNPTVPSENAKLSQLKNWSDPILLQDQYVRKVNELSHNYASYKIIETREINDFPEKISGYEFTVDEYLSCLDTNSCNIEKINYQALLEKYNICDRVNNGEINELWLWGGPWFGYFEANMAGPDGFHTQSPNLLNTTCKHHLHIMGFNYERGLAEMLHNLGHRVEGTMRYQYRLTQNNHFSDYTSYDQANPGRSNCGTVHYPPNGKEAYDYGNYAVVNASCESWLQYPTNSNEYLPTNCEIWGCSHLGYMEYWLSHLPHSDSRKNGSWNNWWKYIIDYENAILIPEISSPIKSVSTYCEETTSLAKINFIENPSVIAKYLVDINDTQNDWTYANGFWHTTLLSSDIKTIIVPTNFKNAFSSQETMQELNSSKTYSVRIFYPTYDLYSDTIEFVPKDCTHHLPGDFNADGHVNSSDYAIFIAGFQSKKYTNFDYVSLVANYGK